MSGMVPKRPLGAVPWLPARAWCEDHAGDRYDGPPCPRCVPVGGPHLFLLPDANLGAVRTLHVFHAAGLT